MTLLQNKWLILGFRFILGIMMMYASFSKIADPKEFASLIDNYQFLPYSLTNLMAIFLPWVELYVGACLILGIFVDGAALLTMGMMLMFIIALSQATIRGLDIECGCFTGASKVGVSRILEDILWLAMTFVVWQRRENSFEIYPKSV